jgi:GAF domain
MEHQSLVDQNAASGVAVPRGNRNLPATLSVSAGIAAVTAHPPRSTETQSSEIRSSEIRQRFPGEDGGQSLAEMACNDLDAALQLLAERAQYITGASGAAIALRRGEHNDMLCRASAGSNAPELGALLSMEYGLSGESVRRRQAMRCDDAENDPRVNREGCRRLGISSVVVMPIVSDEQALGVFELFSGKPQAFDERDLSALQRLSEMIETAVKHAAAAQNIPFADPVFADPVSHQAKRTATMASVVAPASASAPTVNDCAPQTPSQTIEKKEASKKPFFWSVATHKQGNSDSVSAVAESSAVPPILRKLQKCQACGFPVSPGRTLCVECEEKQWRGQILPRPAVAEVRIETRIEAGISSRTGELKDKNNNKDKDTESMVRAAAAGVSAVQSSIPAAANPTGISKPTALVSSPDIHAELPQNVTENPSTDGPLAHSETPFLTSTLESKSWFTANKYVLGALLAVAVIIGLIAWLR